jgi:hypothetical protein
MTGAAQDEKSLFRFAAAVLNLSDEVKQVESVAAVIFLNQTCELLTLIAAQGGDGFHQLRSLPV